MPPDVILDAVMRGWTAEQIEEVNSKYALESPPHAGAGFKVIGEATVRHSPRHSRGRDGAYANKPNDGNSAMAEAFKRAAAE